MLSQQLTDFALNLMQTSIQAALMITPKMGLFKGNPSLSNNTVLATLTALAPTYTGYALSAMTAEALRRDASGNWTQPFDHAVFQPSASGFASQDPVTGYFVQCTISATDHLVGAEYLATPFVFVDEFSALTVDYEFTINNILKYGGLVAQY